MSLKKKILSGIAQKGIFLQSFSPVVAEMIGWLGYDFAVIDLEHGFGDTSNCLPILQSLDSSGTSSMIRCQSNDPVYLKKILDLGPQGVLIPMVNNAVEAEKAVSSCHYPPKGIRGVAHGFVRASRYGLSSQRYLENYQQDLLVAVQIESMEAAENVEEISMVEGIDALFIGPYDLRASANMMDSKYDHDFVSILNSVEKKVVHSKKILGGFPMGINDTFHQMKNRGYSLVAVGTDITILRDSLSKKIEDCKKVS